ncbi:hypothetical protein V8D89_001385 [Ganoderma adspersum]
MAATILTQNSNAPSIAELLFLLSESSKLVEYAQETPPRVRETLRDSVVRIIGIHTKHVSGAVRLENRPDHDHPTLLISSDDPAFLDHVNTAITLFQKVDRAGSDSDVVNAPRAELISYILRHSLSPHAVEYTKLRDKLQKDLNANQVEDTTRDPDGVGTKWLCDEVGAWCDGLTYALNVINNTPDAVPASNNTEEADRFWGWARARYGWLVRMENVYDHVSKDSELPDAVDLLRYLKHIVKAIVPPLMAVAVPNPEAKHSQLAWLHNLTTERLRNSQSSSEPMSIDINPGRLEKWLFALVYKPPLNARVSREVVGSLIGAESVREKWTSYVENASIHPEATQLIDVINTSLAHPGLPQTRRSVVARTSGRCLACAMCYEATRQVYGLEQKALYLFPTEGHTTPGSHGNSPCRMPPLPTAVEEKLKGMLAGKINALLRSAILARRRASIVLPARG